METFDLVDNTILQGVLLGALTNQLMHAWWGTYDKEMVLPLAVVGSVGGGAGALLGLVYNGSRSLAALPLLAFSLGGTFLFDKFLSI